MPRSKRTPPNCRGRPGRNSLLLQTGVLAAARPRNTRSRRLRQFHHLLCSILLWAVFVFCFFPGNALAHDRKDSEPDGADQARQWIEQGLDHFKDVKITDQYISFSDGKKINVIVLPRIYWTNYTRTRHQFKGGWLEQCVGNFEAGLEFIRAQQRSTNLVTWDDWGGFYEDTNPITAMSVGNGGLG